MNSLNGKYIFGMVKVGEKGQIVIPKEARTVFNIKPGDSLMLVGDEKQGLAIITSDALTKIFTHILNKEDKSDTEK
ncbi:looped-hinge helix DNA binding domain, AbrB family [Longilinea arvoryzae]|uniref:Looped-hinge helix DNA binding domain, AbrB family n=1 Tax=Longilinea arvoryzae TaxID=360412 RepID=A0A0S7BMN1_9CHLR|nr:AbrB/MazE/SpoVT family DNA-binding domain-containing protein [Longilinea arvoryzae]GAP15077.1 looped-hinge helix DNA binding domain, AbrB family [Longilinea arvoryzae]